MTEEQQRQNRKATTPAGGGSFRPRRRCSRLIPTCRERVCASLAPRLGRKSLAANVVVFVKWGTKEADFGTKNTSASLPRRLRRLRRFLEPLPGISPPP